MAEDHKQDIVIVTNGFQTDYMWNLVNGISKHCRVLLICSNDLARLTFDSNVVVKNLRGDVNSNVAFRKKIVRLLRYYRRLFSFIAKSRAKVLHIQWLRVYVIDGIFLTLFARARGKRVVYTAHDVLPHDKDTLTNRLLFRMIYKLQNEIIAHTNFIRKRLIDEFGLRESKVHFIEHGVYEVEEKKEISVQKAREKYGIEANDFVILFFGRIARYKGVELVASILDQIDSDRQRVRLIIAGRASKDYEADFMRFYESVKSDKIIPRFGFIEDQELEWLFKASSLTVLPYQEASQSGVLFMSYAFGIPVVAPRLGAFPDYVSEPETGVLYHPDSENGLLNALLEARRHYGQPDESRRDHIKSFAHKNFAWDSSGKRLYSLYMKNQ